MQKKIIKCVNQSSVSHLTKVRHRNDMARTLSMMPLGARRVLYLAMTKIDSKSFLGWDVTFKITADEYAKICGIEVHTAYEQLKAAAKELQSQVLAIKKSELLPWIKRPEEVLRAAPEGHGTRMFSVTDFVDYEDGSGCIDLCFSRALEPYVYLIKSDYTAQVLLSAVRFSDRNPSSLYQLVCKKASSKAHPAFFDITLDELKDELGLFRMFRNSQTYLYPEWKIFNRSVIKKSVETIKNSTELDLSYKVIERRKRKAYRLRFSYTRVEHPQADLFPSKFMAPQKKDHT